MALQLGGRGKGLVMACLLGMGERGLVVIGLAFINFTVNNFKQFVNR
jgi:hypothetical protein